MSQPSSAVRPRPLATLPGVFGTRLAFDATGARWALADGRTLRLGRDAAVEHTVAAPDPVHDVGWSADGKLLWACPLGYDLAQGAWLKQPSLGAALIGGLDAPPAPEQVGIAAAACSPDGQELLVATRFQPSRALGGSDDYRGPEERVLVLDGKRALRGALYGGDREHRALAIGPTLYAAGGAAVQLWERPTLRKVGELPHKLVARALAFNAAGDRLAVLTADGAVSLWDLPTRTLLTTFAAHAGDGYAIAFHPTRPLLATGGQDGKLKLWSLDEAAGAVTARAVFEEALGDWVQAVAFAPSGTRLGATARTPQLSLYELPAP